MDFPWPIAVLGGGILAIVIIVLVVMLYKESNARNHTVSILPVKRNSTTKPTTPTDAETGQSSLSLSKKLPQEIQQEWLRRPSEVPQQQRQIPVVSTITLENTNPFDTNVQSGTVELNPPEMLPQFRRPSATALTEEQLMGVGSLPRDINAEMDERDKRQKSYKS